MSWPVIYTLIALAWGGWWWLMAFALLIVWIAAQVTEARLAYYRARFPDIGVYSPPDPDRK